MSYKVRIIVEIVDQPPFETQAATFHKSVEVESEELAKLLGGSHGSARVIAAVSEGQEQ